MLPISSLYEIVPAHAQKIDCQHSHSTLVIGILLAQNLQIDRLKILVIVPNLIDSDGHLRTTRSASEDQ